MNRHRLAIVQNMRPFVLDRIAPAIKGHLSIINALASGNAVCAVEAIDYRHRQTLRSWGVVG